jgi:hydroxyacylglutathione hydrolase
MAPLNRQGPRVLGAPPAVPALSVEAVDAARQAGAWLIDARKRTAFAAAHVPGAMNVELGESFASYVGWLVPFDAPIILVVERAADAVVAAVELLRIGYEHVVGALEGGIDAWVAAGRPTSAYETLSASDVELEQLDGTPPRILDVRQATEWAAGILPGARTVFVADLPAELSTLRGGDRPWTVICRSGARASIAASLLDGAGIPVRLVATGGVPSLPAASLTPG